MKQDAGCVPQIAGVLLSQFLYQWFDPILLVQQYYISNILLLTKMDGQMGTQEHNRVSLLPLFEMRLRFGLKCGTVFRTLFTYRSVISTVIHTLRKGKCKSFWTVATADGL